MRSCQRVASLFSAYLEEEASPAETRFLEGHLTACPDCRDSLEDLRSTLQGLSRLPRVQVSEHFTSQVLARTRGMIPAGLEEPVVVELPVRRFQWAVPLAAAAALVVAVIGVTRLVIDDPASHQQDGLQGAVTMVEGQDPASTQSPVAPEVVSFPGVSGAEEGIEHLGMAQDAYLLENYILQEPAGGGAPTLTRVGAKTQDQVLVTF